MITTIARHTFIEIWRDGRFRWTAAVLLTLLSAALVIGARYQHALVAQEETAQRTEQSRWYTQAPKGPHAAAHYGMYAFKPRLAPAFIDPGVEPYTGIAVWLEAHKQNEMLFRPAEDETLAQRFGDLTVALVLQVVLPLLIVLLAYNLLAGERERGTLRQLLALGLSPARLLAGKTLGVSSALALVIVPALVFSLATVYLTGPSAGANRFWPLALVYIIYLAVFLLLSLAVSARAKSSRLALLVLLGFWAVNCLCAPRTLGDVAAARHPLPEPLAFNARFQQALGDPEGSSVTMLKSRTQALLERYHVTRAEDLPLDLNGLRLQIGEDHGYEIFDRFYGELFQPMEAQNQFLRRAALFFPLLGVQSLSMGLAGTDLTEHRGFIQAAEAQRRAEINIINEDILAHPPQKGEVHLGDRHLWSQVPTFSYKPAALSAVLQQQRTPLLCLLVWFLAAAAWAWRGVSCLQPV